MIKVRDSMQLFTELLKLSKITLKISDHFLSSTTMQQLILTTEINPIYLNTYKYLVSLLTESREQKSLKHPQSFIKKALDNKTTVSCSTVRVSVRRRVSSVS